MSIRLIGLPSAGSLPSGQSPGLTSRPARAGVRLLAASRSTPARPRRRQARPGQVLVTVRAMMGTTMTITSNNPTAYTYKAELIGADKPVPRGPAPCPPTAACRSSIGRRQASAVRLSDFKAARKDGSLPLGAQWPSSISTMPR